VTVILSIRSEMEGSHFFSRKSNEGWERHKP
jgi:hypothetical protein